MLRGPKGSAVTIWVDRKSWSEARKFSIVRERIKLESVESKLLSSNVGYIKIKNFQQNTGQDLDEHIEKLTKKNKSALRGLVLDLRNNPGGLLEQAIRVSDKFLSSGDIVTTVGYGNKLREPKRAQWSSADWKTRAQRRRRVIGKLGPTLVGKLRSRYSTFHCSYIIIIKLYMEDFLFR